MTLQFAYRRYRLPFRTPFRTAHGVWSEREGVIVRITDESGRSGYGEAAPIPWFGTETVDDVEAACGVIGEFIDASVLASISARLGCLRNAVAAAQSPDEADPPPQAHLGVAALLPAGRPALEFIEPKAALGFRVFKWKVGVGDLGDELALLDDVCARLPDGAKLRLDANGAWNRREAERWLERCAERPVEFVEQPVFSARAQGASAAVRADDLLLGLAGDFPTPIGLDESIAQDGDVATWLDRGWPGVFVVKPALLAEVGATLRSLAKAKAAVVFSSALETALGARASLLAAFSWAGEQDAQGGRVSRALGFGVWPLFADSRFDGPFATPFLRIEDVKRISPEALWTALN